MSELSKHIGHYIVCVSYGKGENENVAIECETCYEVIIDSEVSK